MTNPWPCRFDHTVPFARLLAANPYDPRRRSGIRLPWRRMAVGPVFRADTPQSGRYRQFYQFDIDIAGTASMMADAEIVAVMYETMKALGVENFKIRINDRKVLNGLAVLAGVTDREGVGADDIVKEMMRILDKLDKIGLEKVLKELQAKPENPYFPSPNLSEQAAESIRAFLELKGNNSEKIARCREVFEGIEIAREGLDELAQMLTYLNSMGQFPRSPWISTFPSHGAWTTTQARYSRRCCWTPRSSGKRVFPADDTTTWSDDSRERVCPPPAHPSAWTACSRPSPNLGVLDKSRGRTVTEAMVREAGKRPRRRLPQDRLETPPHRNQRRGFND